jgi:hypothetical protein
MFCGECGTQNPDTNQFCKNCGKPLRKPGQAPAPQPAAVPVQPAAAPVPVQPVYYPPPPAGVQQPVVAAGAPAPAKPPSNKMMLVLAIVGFIIGIVSWIRYPYLLGILAIVIGGIVIAKPENRKGVILILAVLAILVGLSSIVFDMFYLVIMPPVPPDL